VTTTDGHHDAVYDVELEGTGLCFPARAGERLLGAARRAGVWLPFECGWGSCSSCKVTLVEGSVDALFPEAPAIDRRDERRRRVLACQSAASSDLVLKAQRVSHAPDEVRPTRDAIGTLTSMEIVGPDLARFHMRLTDARGHPVVADFRSGQYAVLELAPGLRRCYSLAGLPGEDRIELIAKKYAGGAGSNALFALTPGDRLAIELPYGDMWLRDRPRPVLLAAGGTGISAILSLLRHLAASPATSAGRRVRVLYGAARVEDLACWDDVVTLVNDLPDATLHGALVAPEAEWSGTRGFVTHALEELAESGEHHDLGDSDVYLAGPPVMVLAVQESLRHLGIEVDRVFVDSFG